MPFKFNDIWKFTTKYITTNKKVTIGIDETVKPDDNYDLNVTYNSDNYLASFNSDKIHENTLPLNKKYVSKFNKDKNKNITITNPIINTLDFINIDDTSELNNNSNQYNMGQTSDATEIIFEKRNNNYFNDSLYLLYKFDISDLNTYNADKTTFLNPMNLDNINTNFDNFNENTDGSIQYTYITDNISLLNIYNIHEETIDNNYSKIDFYNFQGNKYIIGNSSLTLNNKFLLFNHLKYKNKKDNTPNSTLFNFSDLFPSITISFWFYINSEDYNLILFNIANNSGSDSANKAGNSIYYENSELKYKKHNNFDFYQDSTDEIISDNISINKWYHLSIISHKNDDTIMDKTVYDHYHQEYDYSIFNLTETNNKYKLPPFNKTYFILDGILKTTVNLYLFDNFADSQNYICFGSFKETVNKFKIIDETPHNGTLVKYGYIDDFRMYNTILTPKLIQKKIIGDILFINNNTINTIGNTGLIFTSFEEKLEIGGNDNNYELIVHGNIESETIKINNLTSDLFLTLDPQNIITTKNFTEMIGLSESDNTFLYYNSSGYSLKNINLSDISDINDDSSEGFLFKNGANSYEFKNILLNDIDGIPSPQSGYLYYDGSVYSFQDVTGGGGGGTDTAQVNSLIDLAFDIKLPPNQINIQSDEINIKSSAQQPYSQININNDEITISSTNNPAIYVNSDANVAIGTNIINNINPNSIRTIELNEVYDYDSNIYEDNKFSFPNLINLVRDHKKTDFGEYKFSYKFDTTDFQTSQLFGDGIQIEITFNSYDNENYFIDNYNIIRRGFGFRYNDELIVTRNKFLSEDPSTSNLLLFKVTSLYGHNNYKFQVLGDSLFNGEITLNQINITDKALKIPINNENNINNYDSTCAYIRYNNTKKIIEYYHSDYESWTTNLLINPNDAEQINYVDNPKYKNPVNDLPDNNIYLNAFKIYSSFFVYLLKDDGDTDSLSFKIFSKTKNLNYEHAKLLNINDNIIEIGNDALNNMNINSRDISINSQDKIEIVHQDSLITLENNNIMISINENCNIIINDNQVKIKGTLYVNDNEINSSGVSSESTINTLDNGLVIKGFLDSSIIETELNKTIADIESEIGLIVKGKQYNKKELFVEDDITAFYQASDIRLKDNIKPLSKSINLIKKLKPVTFKWKKDIFNKNMRNKKDVGFIAQELEEILPLCVKDTDLNNNTYKYLKHERIIPYLVNTIQELIERVENLEKKI
tara:strand:- start:13093 stop:16758 length:3666 start_codon:yes stop_codon:yes gene_type:complete